MNIILVVWGVNATSPLNVAQLGYRMDDILVNLLIKPEL